MIKDALQWLRDSTAPLTATVGPRTYLLQPDGRGFSQIDRRIPEETIEVATLDGFVAAALALKPHPDSVVSVSGSASHWEVGLLSELREQVRDCRVRSVWPGEVAVGVLKGNPGSLMLEGQVLFQPDAEQKRLLATLGSITDTSEVRVLDDLVTQEVSGKQAMVVGMGWGKVENPFHLRPRVIYDEIAAPVVSYVLRLSKDGNGFTASLTPIRGTSWQTAGIRSIVEYLAPKLPGVPVVG